MWFNKKPRKQPEQKRQQEREPQKQLEPKTRTKYVQKYTWHTKTGSFEAQNFVEDVVTLIIALPPDKWENDPKGYAATTENGAHIVITCDPFNSGVGEVKLFLDGEELAACGCTATDGRIICWGYDGIKIASGHVERIMAARRWNQERPAREAKEAETRLKAQQEAEAEKKRYDAMRRRL